LDLAMEGNLADNLDSWVKKMSKAEDAAKIDFVRSLGNLRGGEVVTAIKSYFSSSNSALKQQAIASAVLVGENQVLPDFLRMLDSANEAEILAIKNALLTMEGKNISDEVAKAIPQTSAEAKTALIQVLASRPSPKHMPVVLE